MRKIYLTVIIPSYNEAENIRRGVLKGVRDYLRKQKYSWEVIVSDDGSTDESSNLVKKQIRDWKGFRLLENAHGGKPAALLNGIKESKGKYILFTDMDQSTPIGEVSNLLAFTEKKFDAIIGSRGMKRKNFPIYRRLGAIVFMTFRKALILPEINDTQCGFKLFEKNLVKKSFPRLEYFRKYRNVSGWKVTSYDVELLHIMKKAGARIKEVRVVWDDKDKSGSKGGHLRRYLRESWDMLMQILRVKLGDMCGLYN